MKAIVQHGYGPPARVLRLDEIDPPPIGPGEVLVRMRATSVNTPDWSMVAGLPYVLRARYGLRGPAAPVRGSDVAGVVEAVGAGVTDLSPGDEVVGSQWDPAHPTRTPGTFAELTAIPATRLVAKPPACPFEEAGALGMSGLTALAAVRDVGEVTSGTRVLVNGASGGVGTFAVQIAKALGAEVSGVCGPGNVELVRSLGADHVIDHTREDFTAAGPRYDVVLDNVMNHRPSVTSRTLAPGGRLVPNSLGASGRFVGGLPRLAGAALLGRGSTDVRFVTWAVDSEHLQALAALVASGDVRVVVDRAYPLEDAPAAVAHMMGHHAKGNVVIRME